MFDDRGNPSVYIKAVFDTSQLPLHIYQKEMVAVVEGIEAFFRRHPNELALVVVVDNSAVAWGLRNGFTNHVEGMKLLLRVSAWLERIVGNIPKQNKRRSFQHRFRR